MKERREKGRARSGQSTNFERDWEFAKGGGRKRSVRFGGGGGKRTIKCPLQTQLWRPQKVGFVWSVPVSCKENDIA